jgi:hypothetical protein
VFCELTTRSPYHGDVIPARHRPLTQYREVTWLHSTRSPSTLLWCLAPHPCLFIKCCGLAAARSLNWTPPKKTSQHPCEQFAGGQGDGGRERKPHRGQCGGTAAAPPGHALTGPTARVCGCTEIKSPVRARRPCPSTSYLLHGPPSLDARLAGLHVLSPCGRGGIGRRTSLRC